MQTGLLVVKYTIMIRAPDSKWFPQWRSYALALICLAKIFNPVHLSPRRQCCSPHIYLPWHEQLSARLSAPKSMGIGVGQEASNQALSRKLRHTA